MKALVLVSLLVRTCFTLTFGDSSHYNMTGVCPTPIRVGEHYHRPDCQHCICFDGFYTCFYCAYVNERSPDCKRVIQTPGLHPACCKKCSPT